MQYKDIKVGQLVVYPSIELFENHRDNGTAGSFADEFDIGIIIKIRSGPEWPKACDVFWSSDGRILRVDVDAIDLLGDVRQ